MKTNYRIMRTIKKNMRDDEYKINNRYLDSALLFNRLSTGMKNLSVPLKSFKNKNSARNGKLIYKSAEAAEKVLGETATS